MIEFDAAKDAKNRRKHGLPLAAFADIVESTMRFYFDAAHSAGEDRWIVMGLLWGCCAAACTSPSSRIAVRTSA